jgi:hypothetical protein
MAFHAIDVQMVHSNCRKRKDPNTRSTAVTLRGASFSNKTIGATTSDNLFDNDDDDDDDDNIDCDGEDDVVDDDDDEDNNGAVNDELDVIIDDNVDDNDVEAECDADDLEGEESKK